MYLGIKRNNYIKIFIIIAISVVIDNYYIGNIISPPGWDQGYHLSNVFKMFNIFESSNLTIFNKIDKLLNITDSYRGPLTYFVSAIFLKIFKNTFHYAYLSNQLFSIICILSIFNLGKIFKDASIGIWASIIFTFSSLIINQRSDYLIDFSLTSFSTLNLLFLTKWYFDDSKNITYSILSGISFALVFLTKPTGIVIFFFPILMIIFKKFKNKESFFINFQQILFFIFSFIAIIYPWFSRNWLTIITSTLNAFKWGINYQDGLEVNTLEGWLYYFKKLPEVFGILNFSIFSIIFIFEKIVIGNLLNIKIKKINF